jgi:putative chitinase
MISITAEQLRALAPDVPLARASQYAAALTAAVSGSTLNTPLRLRHFMAQLAWESAGFRALVENLNYRNPDVLDRTFKSVQGVDHARRLIEAGPVAIGNLVYANKLGNGSVDSGDGFRYRGRGFIMTTGRANYASVATYSKIDVVGNPICSERPSKRRRRALLLGRPPHQRRGRRQQRSRSDTRCERTRAARPRRPHRAAEQGRDDLDVAARDAVSACV